jgi:hypothetical protein
VNAALSRKVTRLPSLARLSTFFSALSEIFPAMMLTASLVAAVMALLRDFLMALRKV